METITNFFSNIGDFFNQIIIITESVYRIFSELFGMIPHPWGPLLLSVTIIILGIILYKLIRG